MIVPLSEPDTADLPIRHCFLDVPWIFFGSALPLVPYRGTQFEKRKDLL